MAHQDIIDLITEGNVTEAKRLIAARERQDGISGHDRQIIDAVLAKPRPAAVSAVSPSVPSPVEKKPRGRKPAEKSTRKKGKK